MVCREENQLKWLIPRSSPTWSQKPLAVTSDTEKRKPSDELLTTLAKNLKALRESHGWSQEKLGEKCGCHPTFISMVERKQRNVTISTLEIFAAALGVKAFQLLDDNFNATQT